MNSISNYFLSGMFPELFKLLNNRTGIDVKYGEPLPNYQNFTNTMNDDNQTLFFPIMKEKDDMDCFVPVMQTNGPAYFIRQEEIVPLTLLGRGLLQGWQVIALTIVLAAISGIFIWLMVSIKSNIPILYCTILYCTVYWYFRDIHVAYV